MQKRISNLIKGGLTILISVLIIFTIVQASTTKITPPTGAPVATFYSLSEIANFITANTTATEGSPALDWSSALEDTASTTAEIYDALVSLISADKVFTGITYLGTTGTLKLACATSTFDGISNLVANGYDGNGDGTNRWCVTDSGDAITGNILLNKIAWVDGVAVTGSIADCADGDSSCYVASGKRYANECSDSTTGTQIACYLDDTAKYVDSNACSATSNNGYCFMNTLTFSAMDADLATGNIAKDVNIFGVDGNSNVVDTSAGTVTNNAQIRSNYVCLSDGAQYTGSIADCTDGDSSCYVASGKRYANECSDSTTGTQIACYLDDTAKYVDSNACSALSNDGYCFMNTLTFSAMDTNLATGNIASGVNIFGVDGTLAGGLPDENQTACYNDTVACTCGEAGCTGDTDWPNQTAQNGEDGNRENDLTVDGCGSGTVLDSLTGLCWEQNAGTSSKTWKAALQECNNLDLGGHTDWRLPKASELVSIVDYGYENSSYWHTTKFTNYAADYYWSGTTYPSSASYAYYLLFSIGLLRGNDKAGSYYVVCVREN